MPVFQPKKAMANNKKPSKSRNVNYSGSRLVKEFIDWAEVVVTAVIAVVILFTFVFRVVGIDGPSMMKTLNATYGQTGHTNDMVIISHVMYTPEHGDIVVVSRNWNNEEFDKESSSETPIVKRIIAVAGDTVEIKFDTGVGLVFVNGEELSEPYINEPIDPNNVPSTVIWKVPPGKVFLMGDNRNKSLDSRSDRLGPVDERYILGKVVMRIFPLNEIRMF